MKEPVFSEDHLSLCNDKTLLLLRTEEEDTLVLLHKAREGQFTVSLKDSDSDIKVMILLILIFFIYNNYVLSSKEFDPLALGFVTHCRYFTVQCPVNTKNFVIGCVIHGTHEYD